MQAVEFPAAERRVFARYLRRDHQFADVVVCDEDAVDTTGDDQRADALVRDGFVGHVVQFRQGRLVQEVPGRVVDRADQRVAFAPEVKVAVVGHDLQSPYKRRARLAGTSCAAWVDVCSDMRSRKSPVRMNRPPPRVI